MGCRSIVAVLSGRMGAGSVILEIRYSVLLALRIPTLDAPDKGFRRLFREFQENKVLTASLAVNDPISYGHTPDWSSAREHSIYALTDSNV